ncbi:hypothetical protein M3P19_15000 [Muricauda sp. 2012CJ35-5]|uniref:DUF4126 domain-containing protein n=1 Tax=Flagellimonas spongiicola TaxID=2942208 RepID=A0ABT0PXW8_9FLAO|nr:hypothetical protein [Allomuricauda spongiicola]MCL6275323.1 hypothetical protein [Allomuricauda spongiicola]
MRTLIPTLMVFLFVQQSHAQVERDKALHFLGGNLFGLAGAGIAKQASDGNRLWTFVGSVAGSALIGVAKEAVDAGQRDNGWDNDDLAATVLGGVTVGVTIELFSKKKKNTKRPMGGLTTEYIDPELFKVESESLLTLATDSELPTLNAFGFTNTSQSLE